MTKQPTLKVADILIGRTNPRKEFDTDSINELAASIKEQGVLQPILCRPKGEKFELVCGERRLRASKIAGLLDIPVVVRELTDDQALELQIIENLQRKDVHPLEEAFAYKNLIAIKKMSPEDISKRVGKTKTYITQRLKLNDIIKQFQEAFYKGQMELVDAMKLCKLAEADQKELWDDEFKDQKNTFTISDWDIKKFLGDLSTAPFNINDPDLKKEMGPCSTCRHNTASATSLFPETESKAKCMNVACFKQKSTVGFEKELKASLADPLIQLISKDSYSNDSKLCAKLTKEGHKVLKSSAQYEIQDAPDLYTLQEFFEDNEDDYLNKEAARADWEKEGHQKDYDKELKEYNEKITSGKYIKSYVIDGHDAGKYVYVKLKAAVKGVSGESQKKVKENVASGKVTKTEIDTEVNRIREREKRTKELDIEKISAEFSDLLDKTTDKIQKSKEMSIPEVKAAIIMLIDYGGYSFESKFYKLVGSGGGTDYKFMKPYKFLEGKSLNQLWSYYIAGIRALFHSKLSVNTPNYETNGKSAVTYDILKWYDGAAAKKIVDDQMKVRADRGERIEGRIKGLKNQLTGSQNSPKKDQPKKAAKKTETKKKK